MKVVARTFGDCSDTTDRSRAGAESDCVAPVHHSRSRHPQHRCRRHCGARLLLSRTYEDHDRYLLQRCTLIGVKLT